MGGGGFDPKAYSAGVDALKATGATFARSAAATATGDFSKLADILNPRKLKNGMRECCFAPGFSDAMPIVVSIDGTGSMSTVPVEIQAALPGLIESLVAQGITDHPNVMFICHDDEIHLPPDAAFQMSQFETGAKELTESLNQMIIPGLGGGNCGEGYHISFYAAANHTRLEPFERDGTKGYFVMICDEQPYYDAADPAKFGTKPSLAKEIFGDDIQAEVTMLDSVKKVAERYHIFIIRPGHTQNGKNRAITKLWQKLLSDAGVNPEHVLEVEKTADIIPTITLAIGRLNGADDHDMVSVLKASGIDAKGAISATSAVVPYAGASTGLVAVGKASAEIVTTKGGDKPKGHARR
ncbi:MAG: hypothetical protein WCF94_00765 [bacterium]